MKNDPLVSVIIIFLNAEKFIHEAIESVISQTYSNWELILVDDGSTDGSTEIVRRFANRYASLASYHEHTEHLNKGMSASRNLGIHQACTPHYVRMRKDHFVIHIGPSQVMSCSQLISLALLNYLFHILHDKIQTAQHLT